MALVEERTTNFFVRGKNSEKQTVNIQSMCVSDDKSIFDYTSVPHGANADQILFTATKIHGRDVRRSENVCRGNGITRIIYAACIGAVARYAYEMRHFAGAGFDASSPNRQAVS